MRSAPLESHERSLARADALQAAKLALNEVRSSFPGPGAHRAMRSTRLRLGALLQSLTWAILFTALLLWGKEPLMHWWAEVILFWGGHLGIPLHAGRGESGLLLWIQVAATSVMPTRGIVLATTAAVIALYGATFWMPDAMTPLKYLIRTLCVVQATAILFFTFEPSLFTYTIPGHLQAILNAGYGVMLAVPALLALGYGVLPIRGGERFLHTAGVLAYFALMVPHMAVLHAIVLQHLSVLFMPLLYLCFGVVFDVMIFVALYSWLASRVPADALNG
ncbi:MAG: hypothetical protein HIU89_07800 [Proteobacteria bacterium]|nr:hypothetical protein [Pseudomonadota bacterium]